LHSSPSPDFDDLPDKHSLSPGHREHLRLAVFLFVLGVLLLLAIGPPLLPTVGLLLVIRRLLLLLAIGILIFLVLRLLLLAV